MPGPLGGEQYTRRFCYIAVRVPLRAVFYNRGSGTDRACTELRAGYIHNHHAWFPGFLPRAAEVPDHPGPFLRVVVSAIDTHTVHAVIEEAEYESVILSGFARHRHHYMDVPPLGRRAEERLRVLVQQLPRGFKIKSIRIAACYLNGGIGEPV